MAKIRRTAKSIIKDSFFMRAGIPARSIKTAHVNMSSDILGEQLRQNLRIYKRNRGLAAAKQMAAMTFASLAKSDMSYLLKEYKDTITPHAILGKRVDYNENYKLPMQRALIPIYEKEKALTDNMIKILISDGPLDISPSTSIFGTYYNTFSASANYGWKAPYIGFFRKGLMSAKINMFIDYESGMTFDSDITVHLGKAYYGYILGVDNKRNKDIESSAVSIKAFAIPVDNITNYDINSHPSVAISQGVCLGEGRGDFDLLASTYHVEEALDIVESVLASDSTFGYIQTEVLVAARPGLKVTGKNAAKFVKSAKKRNAHDLRVPVGIQQ